MDKNVSVIISWLRFPLAAFIVFKHYYTPDINSDTILHTNNSVYYYLGEFITHIITAVPVPLFFFISGYLYFSKVTLSEGFSKKQWVEKTKSRIKSLLVPYISWNFLVLLLFAITQSFSNNSSVMAKDGYKLIADYSMIDYLKAFYAIDSTGMPIDGPLWFIRDLFIVSLFSPLIYFICKRLKLSGIVLLGLFWFMGLNIPIQGFSLLCIFFFTLGGYMKLYNKNLTIKNNDFCSISSMIILLIILVLFSISFYHNSEFKSYLNHLYRISSVILVFPILNFFARRNLLKFSSFLMASSFFIFAFHKPVQVIIRRLSFAIINPETDMVLTIFLFVTPSLVILFSLAAFYIIKRYIPVLSFLNGFRL